MVEEDGKTQPKKHEDEKQKGKFIVERDYVEQSRIVEPESLTAEGVDISGRWGTIVLPRTIQEFDTSLYERVKSLPGGAHIANCWQCGNCSAACPVAHEHPEFNPRYLIHIVRMGYTSEIERLKDTVYLCSGCGLCSSVCPRGVDPQHVMVALSLAFHGGGSK
ncbi:MAG: 4Fe-4S dicluster domain-containing protein [Thermoprotei archaeon]